MSPWWRVVYVVRTSFHAERAQKDKIIVDKCVCVHWNWNKRQLWVVAEKTLNFELRLFKVYMHIQWFTCEYNFI